jgi:hypothetical protein
VQPSQKESSGQYGQQGDCHFYMSGHFADT